MKASVKTTESTGYFTIEAPTFEALLETIAGYETSEVEVLNVFFDDEAERCVNNQPRLSTVGGQPIDIQAGTYVKVGETFTKTIVYTDIITDKGIKVAGPTVTKETWVKIKKAQSLLKQFDKAEAIADRNLRQARYLIVNWGSEKEIARLTAIADKAKARADRLYAELLTIGVF
jgi:hypothetical protein